MGPVVDRQGDRQMESGPGQGGQPRAAHACGQPSEEANHRLQPLQRIWIFLVVRLILSPGTNADTVAGHGSAASQDAWRAGGAGADPRRSRPRRMDKPWATNIDEQDEEW
jgi:hypothetical protein